MEAFAVSCMQTVGLLFVIILIHEAGHFAVAYRFGFALSRVEIGEGYELYRTQWRGINFVLRSWPSMGFVLPCWPSSKKWKNIVVYAAGPIANLLTVAAMTVAGRPTDRLCTLSLLMAVYNLVPWCKNGLASDGEQIRREWNTSRPKLRRQTTSV